MYKTFKKIYEDKMERLKARMIASSLCIPIWITFGAEINSGGDIIGTLILLFLIILYFSGIIQMKLNLKVLSATEEMELLKETKDEIKRSRNL